MKRIALLAVLALAGCDTTAEDHQEAVRSCAWTQTVRDWNLCIERANDRITARHNRDDAIAGAMLQNWANSRRECMNIGGIVTCR